MNEIELRENKIDWLGMIDLAFNREKWGDKYNIFVAGNLNISCELNSFNFPDSEATYKLKFDYIYEGEKYSRHDLVYFHLNNSSLEEFKRIVYRKIIQILNYEIGYRTKDIAVVKFKDFKVYSVDSEDIVDSDYNDDYDNANNLSEEYKELVQEEIESKILEELNKDYNFQFDTYVDAYPVVIDDFVKVLNRIKDEKVE